MVLRERHVDEDVADEDKHDAENSERQRLRVVMEVLRDVHIIQPDQCIKVLFFDLDVSELPDFHE